jgi:hypothetical protein
MEEQRIGKLCWGRTQRKKKKQSVFSKSESHNWLLTASPRNQQTLHTLKQSAQHSRLQLADGDYGYKDSKHHQLLPASQLTAMPSFSRWRFTWSGEAILGLRMHLRIGSLHTGPEHQASHVTGLNAMGGLLTEVFYATN